MRAPEAIHAVAWLVWLAAIIAALTVTRNPVYIGLILAWIGVTTKTAEWVGGDAWQRTLTPFSPLRFGLVVVTFSALFNALSVHVGTTVLFTLPRGLPLIGGPVTLEALLYGALNGLALAGLYAAFVLVNRVLSIRQIVQIIPRAYYSLAVVVSIAVTFVPATLRHYRQIREAQAVRGHRVAGLRSWLPLMLPLLTGGMERALQLAEAMMARGFAGAESTPAGAWTRGALAAGLAIFAGGLMLRLVWGFALVGLLALLAGGALVVAAMWRAGRRRPHTVYRPMPWAGRDRVVSVGAFITMAVFLVEIPGIDRSSIYYYPYPSLTWPTFSLVIGVSTWGLLGPVVVWLASVMGRS